MIEQLKYNSISSIKKVNKEAMTEQACQIHPSC